jgi:hypothetical protein
MVGIDIHHFLGPVQNNGAETCSGLGSRLRDALCLDLNTVAWHGCCVANVSDDCNGIDKLSAVKA